MPIKRRKSKLAEPEHILDMTKEELDELAESPFVIIPTADDGVEREGDSVMLDIEAGAADWKTPGVSLLLPITVTEEGVNYGKVVDIYPGVSREAMGITQRLAKALGVYDKVIVEEEGQLKVKLLGFAGGKGRGKFVRTMSNQGNLRSVLTSLNIYPVGTTELGI